MAAEAEDSLAVVGWVAAVTSAAVAFTAAHSAVAESPQVGLAPAEVASALAECAPEVVLRTLRARGHASPRLGTHHTCHLKRAVLQLRVRRLQGNRISVSRTFAITSCRNMMRTGTTTGIGGMPTLTIIASLFLSAGFGAD